MKKTIKFTCVVFLLLALSFVVFLKTKDHSPPPQTPTATPINTTSQPTTGSSTNSEQNNPATVTHTNTPKPKLIATSTTLRSNPNAPQIPYYLMSDANDPYYGSNWALSKIQVNRAWDLSIGDNTKTVAVIDSGFELNHEDLVNRWRSNLGESGQTQDGDNCWTGSAQDKSTNNCDDDNNGYIDDYRGYDFINNDNSPQAGTTNTSGDAVHHGTMVAGVIGATTNNNIGNSGIDQNVKILPLQIFSDDGEAYTNSVVSAIDYATDMHVNVINLSLGSDQFDQTLLSAIQRAISNNITVVGASGNCAMNNQTFCNALSAPGRMTYPALYPEVIAVGSSTNTDQRADYSGYGPQLDVIAPGSSVGPLPVYNNGSTNSYASGSGTSFSAPLVSGLVSILVAQNPGLTPKQVESILTESADTVPLMFNTNKTDEYGFGRINAHKATLLNLALMQDNLLGDQIDSPNQPAVGHIWRSASGSLGSDEIILIGCRIFATQSCGATIQNNGTYWLRPKSYLTRGGTQYIFAPSNSAPNGTWQVSVHNDQYANYVTSVTK
ncbi:MAG: S8 family serine peptidase [Candidatus Nomurabacteria bacterium]|nr:S8 family serine peptidase [Candidatus Saccharibacteria bacterium]USN95345.1 MAG: S8 family serine peptidase [Candidatus Nomurabacteria bacterium]